MKTVKRINPTNTMSLNKFVFERIDCSLTSGHQGRPGRTPYTPADHGGGVAGLEVPGPSGHCHLLDTSEKSKEKLRPSHYLSFVYKIYSTNKDCKLT